MRVLVTGASGHIAAFLIPALLQEGFTVRGLVRSNSNLRALGKLDIELVSGDVQDEGRVRTAMEGCEGVFHLAAPTRDVPGITQDILCGTRNILSTAAACNVSSVVYTSSIVTIGYSEQPTAVLDESSQVESFASNYHSAKYRAEQLALNWAQKGLFKLVVVNPATVIGSLDFRITPSNEVIDRALRTGLKFSFDSGVTIAPVRDVARGHLLALLHGRGGERYILGGDRLTIQDYFRLVQECCGKVRPQVHLPRTLLLGIGAGFSLWHKLLNKQVPFTYTQARTLVGKYGFYSSRKAEQELTYSWISAREAIMDFVEWVRSGRPL